MTPKERRDKLFKPEKPLVRALSIMNGQGYSKDMGILWAAYKVGSFKLPKNLDQEAFAREMADYLSKFGNLWVVDDRNSNFSGKKGPVGIVVGNTAELIIDAQFGFFKWATKRNMLRVMGAFLNMIKNSGKTGICMVRVPPEGRALPEHMKKYDLLYYVGKVSPDEYLYSIRGRAS